MTSHLLSLSMLTILATLIGTSFARNWDGLTVKYGDPRSDPDAFTALPLTVHAAERQGWVKIGPNCQYKAKRCCKAGKWPGVRYFKDKDYAIILLFDIRGNSAGIQTSFPTYKAVGYPRDFKPFVEDGRYGDRWTVTAYFTSPKHICKRMRKGRNPRKGLFLQRTSDPLKSVKVTDRKYLLNSPLWTKGKCHRMMGHYFWSFNPQNVDNACFAKDSFPAFVLYSKKKAPVGFGWTLAMDLPSSKYENPPKRFMHLFLKDIPRCAANPAQAMRNMHIYFTTRAGVDQIECPK